MKCPQCGNECTWIPTVGLEVGRVAVCFYCNWTEGDEVMITIENIENGAIYECKRGKKVFPYRVMDNLKTEITGKNLDTQREVNLKAKDIPRCIKARIDDLPAWRLRNGD